MKIPPGYQKLRAVLNDALEQAALGKGAARHADGKAWHNQPIFSTTRQVGVGFPLGQAIKKTGEAGGMYRRGEIAAARAELLGAIVYLCAAYVYLGEQKND